MSDGVLILLFGLCAIVSAFFSAAETALTAVSDANVLRMKEEGRPAAVRLERLRGDLSQTIGTLLIGNNLANTAAGTLGAALAIAHLGEQWGVVVATVVTAVLLLVVSEVTPKTLASRYPAAVAGAASAPVALFVRLFAPVTAVLSRMANAFLEFFGAVRRSAPDLTKADVRSVINLSRQQGALAPEESAILQAVLTFGDRPARDVMIPRGRVVSIPVRSSFAEIETVCRENRYSRYPVWRESPDDVVGILHVKDLFDVTDEEEKTFDLSKRLRPAVLVPEMKRSEDLFREMRRRRLHMAVVVDDAGAVAGIVTLEDLIEEIVGDIRDEYDEPVAAAVSDGSSLLVDGAYPISSLEQDFGVSFDPTEAGTTAGLLLERLGRIPRPGARWVEAGLEFVVDRASARAIQRVRITRTAGAA
ncbi:MAG TPA: hemolysin family protein [Thermoanaerobaculia bacterium]|nr:hemolysin family protein [Thermoanaerobaculia bacterium]HQR68538.1 hemolysin family protein [Thermoanaerobaculia bacterium]